MKKIKCFVKNKVTLLSLLSLVIAIMINVNVYVLLPILCLISAVIFTICDNELLPKKKILKYSAIYLVGYLVFHSTKLLILIVSDPYAIMNLIFGWQSVVFVFVIIPLISFTLNFVSLFIFTRILNKTRKYVIFAKDFFIKIFSVKRGILTIVVFSLIFAIGYFLSTTSGKFEYVGSIADMNNNDISDVIALDDCNALILKENGKLIKYNQKQNMLTIIANLNGTGSDKKMIKLDNGNIFILGNYHLPITGFYGELVDLKTNKIKLVPLNVKIPFMRVSSAKLKDGNILIFLTDSFSAKTGVSSVSTLDKDNKVALIYDYKNNTYKRLHSFTNVRTTTPSIIPLENGNALIISGDTAGDSPTDIEIFDAKSETFKKIPLPENIPDVLKTICSGFYAFKYKDSKIIIVDYHHYDRRYNTEVLYPDVIIYDMETNTFEVKSIKPLKKVNEIESIMLKDEKILILGGFIKKAGKVNVLKNAGIYDLKNNSYKKIRGKMKTPRQRALAVELTNGNVLIVGGRNYNDDSYETVDVQDVELLKFHK